MVCSGDSWDLFSVCIDDVKRSSEEEVWDWKEADIYKKKKNKMNNGKCGIISSLKFFSYSLQIFGIRLIRLILQGYIHSIIIRQKISDQIKYIYNFFGWTTKYLHQPKKCIFTTDT